MSNDERDNHRVVSREAWLEARVFEGPSGAETLADLFSSHARGIDMLNTAYQYLDTVPKGRDEGSRGPYWVRRHDEYGKK